jgi:hypothetical protein
MPQTERFDVEIISDYPQTERGRGLKFWKTSPRSDQWLVRVLRHSGGNLPLAQDQDYALPKSSFNYGTFIGDSVEIEWDGEQYVEAETYRHGFQPDDLPRDADSAFEALQRFHAETVGSTQEAALSEIAGRSKYAAYLLDQVLGHVSIYRAYPRGAGSPDQQYQAVKMAGAVFSSLGLKRIEAVSKEGCSHAGSCAAIAGVAADQTLSRDQLIRLASIKVQGTLHTYWPHRRTTEEELENIREMFALAAEADANYGPGTGELCLDKLFELGS